jgi:hypothetical protein
MTMKDIARALGVSRGSVSLWTRDVGFTRQLSLFRSNNGPRQRGPNALQRRKLAEIEAMRIDGRRRVGVLGEQAFLVAGAALYAGEGSKRDRDIRFANSDAGMMRMFCAWLRRFFDIDETRLRGRIYLHEGLDYDAALQHWSVVMGIPPAQFRKPYRAVPDPTIRTARHQFGCAYLTYSCSRTHRAIMGLVEALVSSDCLPG